MVLPPWEEVEHTADVALRVRGATLAELFANAARGMLALALGGDPVPAGQDRTEILLSAPDPETLLVDWLTELVYRIEDEAFIPSHVSVLSVEEDEAEKIPISPETRKDRIIESLKTIVLGGSEIRPLIIAFEDLHWVDKSSVMYSSLSWRSFQGQVSY